MFLQAAACFIFCLLLPSLVVIADQRLRPPPPPFNDTHIHYYDPSRWCLPVQPTLNKETTLNNLRRNNYTAPLLFWHVQKTGGSSLCGTFIRSYGRTTTHNIRPMYPWAANCNDQQMSTDIILNPPSYVSKYRPFGKYFVAIEPSHAVNNTWTWVDPNDFPFKYHDQPTSKVLLDPSHPSTDTGWNAAVHLIAIRHPLQLAISAFHYAFQPDRDTIFDRCDAFNMTIKACLLAMIEVVEQPQPSPALSAIYLRYQEEQRKHPSERNTAQYNQEQLELATNHPQRSATYLPTTPPTPIKPSQLSPVAYATALATADIALEDISKYRGHLIFLMKQKFIVEQFVRTPGEKKQYEPKERGGFNDYINAHLHRKRNNTATALLRMGDTADVASVDMVHDKPLKLPLSERLPPSEPLFSVWQVYMISLPPYPYLYPSNHGTDAITHTSSARLFVYSLPLPLSSYCTMLAIGTSHTLSNPRQLFYPSSIAQQ